MIAKPPNFPVYGIQYKSSAVLNEVNAKAVALTFDKLEDHDVTEVHKAIRKKPPVLTGTLKTYGEACHASSLTA